MTESFIFFQTAVIRIVIGHTHTLLMVILIFIYHLPIDIKYFIDVFVACWDITINHVLYTRALNAPIYFVWRVVMNIFHADNTIFD